MGQRGTDVAREAADLILLDDRFASIVQGIALGRRIFANLRRAMTYITAVHIPVAGLAFLPMVVGLPVWNCMTPLNCQPPNSPLAIAEPFCRAGSS